MALSANILAEAERLAGEGDLAAAAQRYVEIVQAEPEHAGAWCRLGEVYHELGRCDQATLCFRRAVALRPGEAVAHNNLGVALAAQGQFDRACDCYREAVRLRPAYAEAHCNLGTALVWQGRLEEAVASYARATELDPRLVAAWVEGGNAWRSLGRYGEAVDHYERALQLVPSDAGLVHDLGTVLMAQGKLVEAIARFEQVLRVWPNAAAVHSNLGLALLRLGRLEDAVLSFRHAVSLQPELAEAHNHLGMALLSQGKAGEAALGFRQALALRPDMAEAQNNLGLALTAQGMPDEALLCFERAAQGEHGHVEALTNLGNAYKDQGRAAEAIACYRRALARRPDDAPVHSNLLLALQYQPGTSPQDMLAEARSYAVKHAAPLQSAIDWHPALPLAGRRLRIGYVSPDFREHPVAFFLEPILATHDHEHFEVFCYADLLQPDAVTERFKRYADHWRSLVGLSDEQVAERIRADKIDILIDLAGHTAGNRLLVFARKPAPVQVSYLGYLGTTGLPAIDNCLTDAFADPPGVSDSHYSEQLVRLPGCALCYAPGAAPEPATAQPMLHSGHVTFGCLNNLAKVSAEVLGLWARVLEAVHGSRLLLPAAAGRQAADRIRATLASFGVGPERVVFADKAPTRFDYLKLYHSIDIGLDPFPYNGLTTTCDALWMGVPVTSLAGRMCVSRQGVRVLKSAGLDELLAETADDYVQIAAELAGNLPRLSALHSTLRERMSRSPLMNTMQFARNLEAAYQHIWEGHTARAAE